MSSIKQEAKKFKEDKLIPFIMKYPPSKIILNKELLEGICQHFDYRMYEIDTKQGRRYKSLMIYLYNIKKLHLAPPKEKGEEMKNGMLVQTVKVVKKKERKSTKGFGSTPVVKEIATIEQTKVKSQYRVIKKVNFSSSTTKHTVERLETQINLYAEIVKDYYYYLGGGKGTEEEQLVERIRGNQKVVEKVSRVRHQFHSIAYGRAIQRKIKNNMDNGELVLDKQTLEEADRTLKLLDRIEKQPLYFMNTIAEGGFNMQKELQGAILNDKGLIENGVVVLGEEQKQVNQEEADKLAKNVIKHSEDPRFKDILQRIEKGQRQV